MITFYKQITLLFSLKFTNNFIYFSTYQRVCPRSYFICSFTRITTLLLGRRKEKEDKELSKVKVSMDGEELERSRSVKCLGVILDDALTWREQWRA